jgi:hypothetical protein
MYPRLIEEIRLDYWDMTVKGYYEDMVKKMTASEPQG